MARARRGQRFSRCFGRPGIACGARPCPWRSRLAGIGPGGAATHFQLALDQLAEASVPHERAEIELRCGAALIATGQNEGAVERLLAAYRTARQLKARPLSAAAAEALAGLGHMVERRAGRFGINDLTRRELQVMRLVALGRSNRAIAKELFLSPRTVEMHVANSMAKLGCGSRLEAVNAAARLGLLGTAANHSSQGAQLP